VTVTQTKAAKSDDARANYFAKLGKSGLADVEAVEVDWFQQAMQYSDLLADLSTDDNKDRWVQWKTDAATDKDGRLVGAGTDIGPQAICYRTSLFDAAGLASDPESVAKLLTGDWATYFKVGAEYTAKTGKPWFDSAGAVWQGMVNQIAAAYEDPKTGELLSAPDAQVEADFTQLLEASAAQSAHLGQWTPDWYAAMSGANGGDFATMQCPGWMLGIIAGNAPDTKDWNIANVFPNGGGNWGGSYLTVPANGKNVAAATAFVDWLTAPEQQVKAFTNAGTFPSQVKAYDDPTLTGATNAYFNNAPTGQIFIDQAKNISVSPFKSVNYFAANKAVSDGLTRVDVDKSQSIADSWTQVITDFDAIKK
jgi:cellobiose transport system substrate-binding protein